MTGPLPVVSVKPRAAVAGPWFLRSDGRKTSAFHLVSSQEIELEGTLHDSVWGARTAVRSLGRFDETFAELARDLDCDWEPASLGRVLRGPKGWGLLFLELTGRCNESCVHCYAGASPTVDSELSWETIAAVLTEAAALEFGGVQFIGGEPLLSTHLPRAVEFADHVGISKLEVFTNGLALRPPLIEHFKRYRVSLAFSVYSHVPAIHDEVTKTPGSHGRTCSAIREALAAGLEVRVVGVEGCATGQNEKALREYLRGLGVAEERIWVDRQRPVGRGSWDEATELLPDVPVSRHADKGFAGRGKLCVTYEGDLVPCIFDRSTVLGNVVRATIRDILGREVESSPVGRSLPVIGEPLACGDCQTRRQVLSNLTWGGGDSACGDGRSRADG